ncbi:hypothetical protein QCA50_013849 [Cerrena zonata]|uniref:F-box domain-containing protein n=1 Tax=Cerrena zonata TaxID=2478898 RepID=A0AAW0G0M5_9APHY
MPKTCSTLVRLPDELILYFLMTLDVTSLLCIRQTCKYVHSISLAKQLWINLYLRDIEAQHLSFAPYWKDISTLTATQTEKLVSHILQLDLRLSQHRPPIRRPFYQRRSITWVRTIHSQWLLVASSDDITSVITLWLIDSLLASKSSAPLAEASLPAPVVTGAVDVCGSCVTLALELRGRIPQIDILSIVKHRRLTLFCRLQTLEDLAHLRFLHGDHIGVSVVNNTNIPCIVKWKNKAIERLRTLPDLRGGAVAMHMTDNWIAVLRRSVLEVYAHDGQHYKYWKALEVSHGVGSASFLQIRDECRDGFVPQPAPLKLCITSSEGVFVYGVLCDPSNDVLSLNSIWNFSGTITDNHDPLFTKGTLGNIGGGVSWLHGSGNSRHFPIKFATVRLPVGDGESQPSIFEWYDVSMPALYALGVYDYDEARGVLVLGNAFGELSLYDFSCSNPGIFSKCFAMKLAPAPYIGQTILPKVRETILGNLVNHYVLTYLQHHILSYTGPPFPTWEDPSYVKTDIAQFWREHRLVAAPPGWSTDFEIPNKDGLTWISMFLGWGSCAPDYFRGLEQAAHFYGRPIPLLRTWSTPYHRELAIFDVGGLLFVINRDEMTFYAVRSGITLQQLIVSIDQGSIPATEVSLDASEDMWGFWFYETMVRERKEGRNRCLELYRRGGRVNKRFLKSEFPG